MRRRGYTAKPDDWTDDAVLRAVVRARLELDDAFWIDRTRRRTMIVVEVEDGFVTLTGIVPSDQARQRATALARALGARGVHDLLRVDAELRREST